MKNINLLKDTKRADDEALSKRSSAGGFDLSEPERFEFKEREGKAASGFSSWMTRMFSRSPKKAKTPKAPAAQPQPQGQQIPTRNYVRSEQTVGALPTTPSQSAPAYGSRQINAPTEPIRPPRPTFNVPASQAPAAPARPTNRPPAPPLPPQPPVSPRTPQPFRQAPVNFDVNLLPEDLVDQYEPRKKLVNLAVISGLTIAAVAAIYVVMMFYQSSIVTKTNEVRSEAATISQQISSYQHQRSAALALKEKVDAISERLNNHVYWSKFFTLLEQNTIPEVYYSNVFAGDINGELVLDATGADYSSVAKQLLAFQQADDFVDSVIINSASRVTEQEGLSGVSFSIQLRLAEGVFTKTEEEIAQ